MKQESVRVGIVSGNCIRFYINGEYRFGNNRLKSFKEFSIEYKDGKIHFNGELYNELLFEPVNEEATFCLKDVIIGISFHWERKDDQWFSGKLQVLPAEGKVVAINILPVEEYLKSVISSEMSATASLEFLKAHAVISRSWLMAQIEKNKQLHIQPSYNTVIQNQDEYIRWYDREDHQLFDVCADDHCQRYQGLSRIVSPLANQSVEETYGEILTYNNKICDTRFSKCCGGITEEFQYVWEPVMHPYLSSLPDIPEDQQIKQPDLTIEDEAGKWIRSSPDTCCNTTDKKVLSQVLNDFDRETTDFYRWQVTYTQQELSDLIAKRSGFDFGEIIDLIPVERGKSGRLVKLKISGTKRTRTIGKELEIRRILSESHLYSSAFVIDKKDIRKGIPQSFTFTGAGWGHGVGLCQIGAAVMGEKGYTYKEILFHYFRNAEIIKKY
ncbi:MAG: SpoIID/LytB domain-containing protein [Candidatus Azobacteroides sp.]|nr:SpoIID/LytB domain-containing protein [Candidatus Azobacteroides sp.]